MIIYSFTALLNMILVPMVEEKACGVKEFLRIASAESWLNNMTFFFTNLLIGCIIFGATLVIAACYQLLGHIAAIWLIILLFLYLTSAIAFTFLLSVAYDSGMFSIVNSMSKRLFKTFFFNFRISVMSWVRPAGLWIQSWEITLVYKHQTNFVSIFFSQQFTMRKLVDFCATLLHFWSFYSTIKCWI